MSTRFVTNPGRPGRKPAKSRDPFAAVRRATETEVIRYADAGGTFAIHRLMDAAYRVYNKRMAETGEQLPVEEVAEEIRAARDRAEDLRRDMLRKETRESETALREAKRHMFPSRNPRRTNPKGDQQAVRAQILHLLSTATVGAGQPLEDFASRLESGEPLSTLDIEDAVYAAEARLEDAEYEVRTNRIAEHRAELREERDHYKKVLKAIKALMPSQARANPLVRASKPKRPLSREQKAVKLVEDALKANIILRWVGPKHEGTAGRYMLAASPSKFAVIAYGRAPWDFYGTANEVASTLVRNIGVGNVIDALKATAHMHDTAYKNLDTPISWSTPRRR